MHTNAQLLFQKYAKFYFTSLFKVLEIGPDKIPSSFANLVNDQTIQWDTLDIYNGSNLTYSGSNPYIFDIYENTYDIVFSANVIEHVQKPWQWIKELARVMKENGHIIIINPVSWPYHAHPIDCWRIYPDGMKALLEEANLYTVLSIWESLETPQFDRYIAGKSQEWQNPFRRFFKFLLSFWGYPVERSYDTITIGRKNNWSRR